MLDRIRRLTTPGAVKNEEQARIARLLVVITIAAMALALGLGVYYSIAQTAAPKASIIWGEVGAALVVGAATLLLLRWGRVAVATVVFSLLLWLLFAYEAWRYGGVRSPEYARLMLIPIFFGLLWGGTGALVGAATTILTGLALFYAESTGLLPAFNPQSYTALDVLVTRTADVILAAALFYLADRTIRDSRLRAQRNEQALARSNSELQAGQAVLEGQAQILQRRTRYLEVLAEVSRATAATFEIEPLLWEVSELIQQRFSLYHVAFLFLEHQATRQWLEYRAGSGEAGRLLRGQRLRLALDDTSSASLCARTGQPRVVADLRAEGMQMERSLLAGARAEAAVPLAAHARSAGVLVAQAERAETLDPEMVTALQNIADQVAQALDRARLFEELQDRLDVERRAAGRVSREEWMRLLQEGLTPGYRYVQRAVAPLGPDDGLGAVPQEGPATQIAVPVRVRGEVIGAIELKREPGTGTWTDEERVMLTGLIDQLGVALDSARLYQETQRRAAQERLASEVAAHVRETLDVDTVLQTALREIGETLDLAEAVAWMEA